MAYSIPATTGSAFAFVRAGLICRLWFSASLFTFAFGLIDFVAPVLRGTVIPTALAAPENRVDRRTMTSLVGGVGLVIVWGAAAATFRRTFT